MHKIKRLVVGPLQTNCYIFQSKDEIAVIDPGGDVDKILQELKPATKIKYIINTHYHDDHTTDNEELKNRTEAKVLIHEDEKEYIDFKVDKFLVDNDEIKVGDEILRVVHLPGHTKGSICLLGDSYVFVGDILFEQGYGRTDLPGGSDIEMEKTLKKLAEIIPLKTVVYSGHGEKFYY